MKLFVTGAAGFIGSNYVRWLLANTDHSVTIYDALTYAGNLASIRDVMDDRRVEFVKNFAAYQVRNVRAETCHLMLFLNHEAAVSFGN